MAAFKVTKQDLQHIFDSARDNLINSTKPVDLDGQQYIAKMYLESCLAFLGMPSVEYEEVGYKEQANE